MKESTTSTVQSVDRALTILSYLADNGGSGVTEVANALEIHKSTASRLLATLASHGFVTQEDGREYRLGVGVVRLAGAVTADSELIRLARPVCKRLSEAVQETVNLSILDGDEVINIDQVIGTASVVSVNWVGRRSPLNCTSTGKVLLAFASADERHRLFRKPLKRCTQHSVLKFEVLEKQLRDIRSLGYSYTSEELELGMNAVAAPVFSFDSEVTAALSISGPSYRMTDTRIPDLGEAAIEAAREISAGLGFQPSR